MLYSIDLHCLLKNIYIFMTVNLGQSIDMVWGSHMVPSGEQLCQKWKMTFKQVVAKKDGGRKWMLSERNWKPQYEE